MSADFQKDAVVRYLAKIEMPDVERSTPPDQRPRLEDIVNASPVRSRAANDSDPISPREHSFVKTTFGKGMSSTA